MRQRATVLSIITLVAILAVAGPAHAATISYTDVFATTLTNWTGLLALPQFNPALGTLTGIDWTLQGNIAGDVRFESLDNEPTTVSTDLKATITLFRPDLTTIIVTTPVSNHIDNVGPFDGTIDFGGTSGKSYLNLTASTTSTAHNPPPNSDLALYTGLGTLFMPITAVGASVATGAGNLISSFNTLAGATAGVVYTYSTTTVPEPSSLALLLVGGSVFALGAIRRYRK